MIIKILMQRYLISGNYKLIFRTGLF